MYLGTLEGGAPRRLADAEAAGLFAPPDRLLLVRQGVLSAWRLDLERSAVLGDPVTIATGAGIDTNLVRGVFSISAGGVLAYRGAITTHRQLVWMDRAGATLGTVGGVDEYAPAAPELSRDGRRVAVQRFV